MSPSSPTEPRPVDVAVIGLGSGGERTAQTLAEAGQRVVAFEPDRVGGECPFVACIPSKVLLHHAAGRSPDWAAALEHRREATEELDDTGHATHLTDAGVTLVRSRAHLVEDHVVEADGRRWHAETVVIATGADAVIPDIDGLDRDRTWTSDEYLLADRLPESVVILGGGPIGCEFATIQAGFGHDVVLADHSRPHEGVVDAEVIDELEASLGRRGVDVRTGVGAVRVDHDHQTTVHFDDGSSATTERLVLAVGTDPNWHGLGLDALGIDEPSVDAQLRVHGLEWLRAVGDVNGRAPWTHGANQQADWLAAELTGRAWPEGRAEPVAHCTFTNPPVASIGPTADRARAEGIDAVRGVATYDDVARPMTDRLGPGCVVIVADRGTGRLLGCSGIGARFDEVIGTVAAWIHMGATVDDAARTVLPFPTVAQVLTPALTAIQRAADA